ncbi:HEAT repeat domain-containing protein [Pararhodonellum marinum]|uniref:HEAT repeat domain-containing protein n=1 Tax=Pararhodonellum marinum TaxID=2755358 RepID=UPI00188EDFBB|nr:HEAT repeat domain-containing protein [Pararhodonellum marinum]
MAQPIATLIEKMCDKNESEAYRYADKLAEIGGEEVLDELLVILKGEDLENAMLAARALSSMKDNQNALDPLLELIHDKSLRYQNGMFVQALEGFDLSQKLVDVFKIYLYGNFKSSLLAKEYLDHVEFDISPRTIRKMEKHWNHYQHNSPEDEAFELKKLEVEEMIGEMKALFDEEE